MRASILTALFGAFALTAAAPQAVDNIREGYPGGSVLLVNNKPGQPGDPTRLHIDINKVTLVPAPSSYVPFFNVIKFHYFLNVDEDKVVCHAFYDNQGLIPIGAPFTKAAPLELARKKKSISVGSILCIVTA